jgi:SAM-dependent methyltransferase
VAGRGLVPLGPHPGHDSYWFFRDLFFDAIVPTPGRLTLEVGCGEGRVARDLARLGHTVVALDAWPTLVAKAAAADPAGRYLLADAAALPFPDACFDAVTLRHRWQLPRSPPVRGHLRARRPPGHLRRLALLAGGIRPRPRGCQSPHRPPARTAGPAAALTARPGYERWQRLPDFLHFRAVKAA